MKYEEALRQLESNELDIDSLTAELKTAQKLVKICKDKLTKTDEEIKKILDSGE